MSSGDVPSFPPELEREIFETAALQYPPIIPSLLLVAHRVLAWIEPFTYRTIVIQNLPCLAIDYKLITARDLMRDNVRHFLCCDPDNSSISTPHDIISVCTGIQRLALYRYPEFALVLSLQDLESLNGLQRLAANLVGEHSDVNLRHSAFSTITHLEILDEPWPGDLADLTLLPALTHISVSSGHYPQFLVLLLEGCTHLEALVNFYDSTPPSMEELAARIHSNDLRLVLMKFPTWDEHIKDWTVGTNGGQDFWSRADLFISKRRRGEIQPVSRCWIE
ncbi:hypothetical protein C8R44DRAFT_980137 [Mycena epipterygia]|nr:hypothetical protein C8R44DRAFT_980137 [Mycena epipterygia]